MAFHHSVRLGIKSLFCMHHQFNMSAANFTALFATSGQQKLLPLSVLYHGIFLALEVRPDIFVILKLLY
jgi:hypothetical protein